LPTGVRPINEADGTGFLLKADGCKLKFLCTLADNVWVG